MIEDVRSTFHWSLNYFSSLACFKYKLTEQAAPPLQEHLSVMKMLLRLQFLRVLPLYELGFRVGTTSKLK